MAAWPSKALENLAWPPFPFGRSNALQHHTLALWASTVEQCTPAPFGICGGCHFVQCLDLPPVLSDEQFGSQYEEKKTHALLFGFLLPFDAAVRSSNS